MGRLASEDVVLVSPQMWKLVRGEDREIEKMRIVFLANLSRHTKAVNVVRFSPNGTSVLKQQTSCSCLINREV